MQQPALAMAMRTLLLDGQLDVPWGGAGVGMEIGNEGKASMGRIRNRVVPGGRINHINSVKTKEEASDIYVVFVLFL